MNYAKSVFFRSVILNRAKKIIVLSNCIFSSDIEQFIRLVGETSSKGGVTCFSVDEFDIIRCRRFGIQRERILAFLNKRRIESEQIPVACCNRFLLLRLVKRHLDTVVDTRRIADDQGRAVISLRLFKRFQALVVIRAHGYLRNIDITVRHSDLCKIFLLGYLTGCGKLSNSACWRCFRSLTAGIGINLCIKYKNIDILILGKNVIQSAEADIISPAVAAEDPLALLGSIVSYP